MNKPLKTPQGKPKKEASHKVVFTKENTLLPKEKFPKVLKKEEKNKEKKESKENEDLEDDKEEEEEFDFFSRLAPLSSTMGRSNVAFSRPIRKQTKRLEESIEAELERVPPKPKEDDEKNKDVQYSKDKEDEKRGYNERRPESLDKARYAEQSPMSSESYSQNRPNSPNSQERDAQERWKRLEGISFEKKEEPRVQMGTPENSYESIKKKDEGITYN